MSRRHSTMIDEQKYEAPDSSAHNRDKDDMKAQTHAVQTGVKSSREAELRRAFEQADFSERAGTPAERLEKMSKAVHELTVEREEIAKQQQIAEDSEFWKAERGKAGGSPKKGPAKLDTRFTVEPTPKVQPPEPADTQPAAKPTEKTVSKTDKPVKESFTRVDDSQDEEGGHGQDYPSERVSKLDRPARVSQAAKEQTGQVTESRPKDDDEEGPVDKLDELPFLERNKFAREAEQEANGVVQRKSISLGGARSLSKDLKQEPELKIRDRASLQATKQARLQDHLSEETFDPDNHHPHEGRTLMNELKYEMSRLSLLGTKGGELHAPVKTTDTEVRHWPRSGVSEVHPQEKEGILSATKHKIGDKIDRAEDKLSEWKHEAGDKIDHLKHRLSGDIDDAKSKARELKEDAVDKSRELRDDWREKQSELKDDWRQKRNELRDGARDAQRSIERRGEQLEADAKRDLSSLKLKGRELRDESKSELSALSDKASALKDKAKSEIREDVSIVKDKLHDMGESVKHKADKIAGKIEHKADDIKERTQSWWDRMDAQTAWWPKEVDSSITRRQGPVLRSGVSGASHPEFDVRADPTDEDYIPSRGRVDVMQSQLDELRNLEDGGWKHDASFAGGIRSQLSNKWQHAKDVVKQADKKIEHDYLEEADVASSSDMDNAPLKWTGFGNDSMNDARNASASPRVVEQTTSTTRWRSLPHPNTFSPSLSDVLPDDDVREHVYSPRMRSFSSAASSPVLIEQRTIIVSPNGGRDLADMLDAMVEPW